MSDQNNLILLTHTFPYGIGEAFLENEINYLAQSFDKIVVIARNSKDNEVRYRSDNFFSYKVNPQSDLKEILLACLLLVQAFPKACGYFTNEFLYLRSRGRKINRKIFSTMIKDLLKALIISNTIKKIILKHQFSGELIIYSYWQSSMALAATFVTSKRNHIRRIARSHHADLYESISPSGYLSYRQVMAKELNGIFAISQHGLNHLKDTLPVSLHHHLFLSRLGTELQGLQIQQKPKDHFLIVSCSFIQKIKRIHLIVEALRLINNLTIKWVHFGDGPQRDEIEEFANDKLNSKTNISFSFYGKFFNPELLKYYQKNFVSLLINTSSSEGIPVSIMEAQSFGIPCIGMDVGGVSEIILRDSGLLLSSNATPEEIAKLIFSVLTLPEDTYTKLRKDTFTQWEINYNAKKNFPTFIQKIKNI